MYKRVVMPDRLPSHRPMVLAALPGASSVGPASCTVSPVGDAHRDTAPPPTSLATSCQAQVCPWEVNPREVRASKLAALSIMLLRVCPSREGSESPQSGSLVTDSSIHYKVLNSCSATVKKTPDCPAVSNLLLHPPAPKGKIVPSTQGQTVTT